jgi:hypothetical protein
MPDLVIKFIKENNTFMDETRDGTRGIRNGYYRDEG